MVTDRHSQGSPLPRCAYCYVAMSARNSQLSFRLGLRTCLLDLAFDLAYVEACCSESTVRCQAEGRRHVRWGVSSCSCRCGGCSSPILRFRTDIRSNYVDRARG